MNLPPYLGSATIDFLALMRRANGNTVPLLAFQHGVGSFGRELCISYDPSDNDPHCNHTAIQGPLAVGDLNGPIADVPPDEIVTSLAGDNLGVFGFSPQPQSVLSGSNPRSVPGGVESAAIGDLDENGLLDVLVGQPVNSVADRVASIHYFKMEPPALQQVGTTLPSIPGLDGVAIADVDGDGCNDVVGAGGYGRGVVHLGDGAGNFDVGQDVPQLGYLNPATATRVTMAVGDLTGDGLPELVITDNPRPRDDPVQRLAQPGGRSGAPPLASDDVATITEDAAATAIDVLANDTDPDGGAKPSPHSRSPRTAPRRSPAAA